LSVASETEGVKSPAVLVKKPPSKLLPAARLVTPRNMSSVLALVMAAEKGVAAVTRTTSLVLAVAAE
jgi:hypothetical protein